MNDLISMERKEIRGFMDFTSLESAKECVNILIESDLVPARFKKKPNDALVAIQMGLELGFQPLQAMREIHVINGKPSLEAEPMLALCKCAPDFEYCHEAFDEEKMIATCIVKRKNEPEYRTSFNKEDATKAGLWNKEGPWRTYPKRMLQHRARSFALRDKFPHVIRGLVLPDEEKERPPERDITPHFTTQAYAQISTADSIKNKLAFSQQLETNNIHSMTVLTPDTILQNTEVIECDVVSDSTLEELLLLTTKLQVSEEEKSKWLTKAKAADLSELTEKQANSIIEMLLKRMV